jgi:hypothetical protein
MCALSRGTVPPDVATLREPWARGLVDRLLCRAGYRTAWLAGRREDRGGIRIGREEFGPDFLAWKHVPVPGSGEPLQRLLTVEVHYRADVDEFLDRVGKALFPHVAQRWPELCVVLVTDRPTSGRSCFQAVDMRRHEPGASLTAVDLATLRDLDVGAALVAEYELAARALAWTPEQALLLGASPRKPPGKLAGRPARSIGSSPPRADLSIG